VFDGTATGAIDETYWGGGNTLTSYQLANVGSPMISIAFAATSSTKSSVATTTWQPCWRFPIS